MELRVTARREGDESGKAPRLLRKMRLADALVWLYFKTHGHTLPTPYDPASVSFQTNGALGDFREVPSSTRQSFA